jgi:hypothetical protein
MAVWLLLACSATHADQETAPRPRVFASDEGAIVFAMLPPLLDDKTGRAKREGHGIAYRMDAKGAFQMLYRTEGWYADEIFLSRDGRYLVRMGPWARGRAPAKDHLAVAFYRDGKLLKQYSTAELVKDASKVRASVSHYFWRADEAEGSEAGGAPKLWHGDLLFTLTTIDRIEYAFRLTDGSIKSSAPNPKN